MDRADPGSKFPNGEDAILDFAVVEEARFTTSGTDLALVTLTGEYFASLATVLRVLTVHPGDDGVNVMC